MTDGLSSAASHSRGDIRIGISGWRYPPWRGVFYPKGLRQKDELNYASRSFRSVEINGTFYGAQRPTVFERWAAETPDDFIFAVKAPRFITHISRLNDIEAPLANFLASGLFELGTKLGPVLWQFPPSFHFDRDRIERFLALLPHDSDAARKLAERHDNRMTAVMTDPLAALAMRHAMEIRHNSFVVPEFIDLLRQYRVGLVCADTVAWPRLTDLTADFVYCRLHGSEELYASGYDDGALDVWATRVAAWALGGEPKDAQRVIDYAGPKLKKRDVYVYFDNDIKVRAPFDARSLAERLSVASPLSLATQLSLALSHPPPSTL